jgi:predicted anti-sigma-YlaC factor YlaD
MEAVRHASPTPACEEARALASLALDDALDEVGRHQLARHLSECPTCTAFVAEIGSLTAFLRGAPLEPYRCAPSTAGYGPRNQTHRAQWVTTAGMVAAVAVAIAVAALPRETPSGEETRRAAPAPVKLPIGQRSAAGDFIVRPIVRSA